MKQSIGFIIFNQNNWFIFNIIEINQIKSNIVFYYYIKYQIRLNKKSNQIKYQKRKKKRKNIIQSYYIIEEKEKKKKEKRKKKKKQKETLIQSKQTQAGSSFALTNLGREVIGYRYGHLPVLFFLSVYGTSEYC